MNHRFVVDETSFQFDDESPAALSEAFERFLLLLDYTSSTGSRVCKWSELFNIESRSGKRLWELLFEHDRVDRDVRIELGVRLDRIDDWDEAIEHWPCYSVDCAGENLGLAPSVGLSLLHARSARVLACLETIQSGRRGKLLVNERAVEESFEVAFIAAEEDGVELWRMVIGNESVNNDLALESLVEFAYPNCVFADGLWSRVKDFEGSPMDYIPRLHHNLEGLNDHAVDIWSSNVEPHVISAEMKSRANVDCSPESPNTRRNAKAMREREVTFDSVRVECQWHAKLEPHRNRIHFAVRNNKVLVGIFAAHLAL